MTANVNHPIRYLFSLLAGGDIPPSAHQRGEIIATDILAGRGMGGFLSAKEELRGAPSSQILMHN